MTKNIQILTLFTLVFAATSCYNVENTAKEVINKTGEAVGKSASEFIEGITEGVDKTLQCDISLSQALRDKGIQIGKYEINNDTQGGQNNVLTLYIIFNQDFKGDMSAKAFDKTGVECGRTLVHVEGKTGNAKYYDFNFDSRTRIEVKGLITIE